MLLHRSFIGPVIVPGVVNVDFRVTDFTALAAQALAAATVSAPVAKPGAMSSVMVLVPWPLVMVVPAGAVQL